MSSMSYGAMSALWSLLMFLMSSSVKPNSLNPPELVGKMENCVEGGTVDVVRVFNKFLQRLLILQLTTSYLLFEGEIRL